MEIELIIDKEFITCTKCNETYPATEEYFYKQKYTTKKKGTFYKLVHPCKNCRIKASEEYTKNHMEQHEKSRQKYYKTEKYRKTLKPKAIRLKDTRQKWLDKNSNRVKEYYKYKQMNKTHKITNEEWENCKNYFNYRCAYCGLPIEGHYIVFNGETKLGDFHKDHANHNGENNLSNCIPACKSCNVQKNVFPLFEWYSPDKDDFDSDRFDKILKWLSEDYKLYIRQ